MYPDSFTSTYDSPCEYQPILDACGTVVVQVTSNDYQGDTWAIVESGGRYGYVNFGWGSCSGCDALQACSSYEEVDELAQQIENDIHWENSAEDMLVWMADRDWETKYCWHEDDFKRFLVEAKDALSRVVSK